jgi:hypothetical protein
MREGTTSRMMAADRLYGKFYDCYSVSPVYFGYTLVYRLTQNRCTLKAQQSKQSEYDCCVVFSCAKDAGKINPLTPELNPSARRCLTIFFTGEFTS